MLFSKFPSSRAAFRVCSHFSALSHSTLPSTALPSPFLSVSSFQIVKSYVRKSDIYEVCVPYDDNWVPSRVKKKKRLPVWDNPAVKWPPVSVRPTQHKGKRLIDELQKEEINKITAERPFSIPPVQAGDVVEVYKFLSLSSGKFDKYTGLVIATQNLNRLSGSITVLGHVSGFQYTVKVKLYSPLLAKINILKYGTNKLRAKQLHYQYKNLSRSQFIQPIVKGKSPRGQKVREEYIRKKLIKKLRRKGIDTSEYEKADKGAKKEEKPIDLRRSVLDEIKID